MFSSEQNFTINGEDDKALEKVLELAFELSGDKIKSFYEDKNGLVFCWTEREKFKTYPFEPTIPVIVEQIKQYINKLLPDDVLRLAGDEPGVDGTVRLGWEVFYPLWYGENEIENYEMSSFLAVRPSWIVYAK